MDPLVDNDLRIYDIQETAWGFSCPGNDREFWIALIAGGSRHFTKTSGDFDETATASISMTMQSGSKGPNEIPHNTTNSLHHECTMSGEDCGTCACCTVMTRDMQGEMTHKLSRPQMLHHDVSLQF